MQILRSHVSHPLTAREFLASFSTCLAAWISSISPAPRNTHTCCCTRTHRRSITLETDRRRSVMSGVHTYCNIHCWTHREVSAAQMSATCSAVLVTRPWCSRRACFWEKRWVWLFLTRERWICAAERKKRGVNINRPRKHGGGLMKWTRWWHTHRQIVAEETKSHEATWKQLKADRKTFS